MLKVDRVGRSKIDPKRGQKGRNERYYGAFRRSITLPAGVDEGDISADYDNGLLEIAVRGAAAAAEPRRIEIRSKPG